MKVVHVITSLDNGGAEGALYRYVTFDKEFEHLVVSLRDLGIYGDRLKLNDVKVYSLNLSKNPFLGIWNLFYILRVESPDLIQTWMYHADLIGGLIGRILGFKVIWGIRNTELNLKTSKLSTLIVAKICAWLSFIVPSRIITCAHAAVESHQKFCYNYEIFEVVPNGYIVKEVQASSLRKDLKLDDDVFLMGMVARFDPFKDHECLLNALLKFSKLNDLNKRWFLILVGSQMTNENKVLVDWIKERCLTKNIALLGVSSEVINIMKSLDLHVLSSNSEAFPNVIAEAMSVGTPCLSTDVGDAAIIIGKTGKIVPAKNPDALFQGISYFAGLTKTQRQKLGSEARSRIIEKFSLDVQCEMFAGIYKKVLSQE